MSECVAGRAERQRLELMREVVRQICSSSLRCSRLKSGTSR